MEWVENLTREVERLVAFQRTLLRGLAWFGSFITTIASAIIIATITNHM